MTPADLQREYLNGKGVEALAKATGISRSYIYASLSRLGTPMRTQGPKRRGLMAAEIFEDLTQPMTVEDLQEWLGASQLQIIGGLLILMRQNKIKFMRVEEQSATPQQGTLL